MAMSLHRDTLCVKDEHMVGPAGRGQDPSAVALGVKAVEAAIRLSS